MEKLNIEIKENFNVECVKYLNIGNKIFNVGDKAKIISSRLVEIDGDEMMRVYNTEEKIDICDFEIDNYFKIIII